jgi:hypothetical protein
MTMLLNRDLICRHLGGCTWRTAKRRLRDLGIQPKRAGREVYITDDQLAEAVSGHSDREPANIPNWAAMRKMRKHSKKSNGAL